MQKGRYAPPPSLALLQQRRQQSKSLVLANEFYLLKKPPPLLEGRHVRYIRYRYYRVGMISSQIQCQNHACKIYFPSLSVLFCRCYSTGIVGQTDGLSQQSKILTRSPRKNRYTPSSTKPSSLAHLLQLIPFEKTNEPQCYRPSHCDRTRLLRLHPGQRYQHACCDSISYHHLIADEAYPPSSC